MSQYTNKTLYMYMHMNFIYRHTCTIYDYDVRYIVKSVCWWIIWTTDTQYHYFLRIFPTSFYPLLNILNLGTRYFTFSEECIDVCSCLKGNQVFSLVFISKIDQTVLFSGQCRLVCKGNWGQVLYSPLMDNYSRVITSFQEPMYTAERYLHHLPLT